MQPCDFISSSTVEAKLDTAVLDTPENDARRRDKNVPILWIFLKNVNLNNLGMNKIYWILIPLNPTLLNLHISVDSHNSMTIYENILKEF